MGRWTTTNDYPVHLRTHLAAARSNGVPFDLAWRKLTRGSTPPEWEDVMPFLHDHFRAAYNRDFSQRGRFTAPEPEASGAVTSTSSHKARYTDTCAWGDGCGVSAGHGLFGHFCSDHAATLAGCRLRYEKGFDT